MPQLSQRVFQFSVEGEEDDKLLELEVVAVVAVVGVVHPPENVGKICEAFSFYA